MLGFLNRDRLVRVLRDERGFFLFDAALSLGKSLVKGVVGGAKQGASSVAEEAARRAQQEAAEAKRLALEAASRTVPPDATAALAFKQFGPWLLGIGAALVGLVLVLLLGRK